jgi:hypothetical protein
MKTGINHCLLITILILPISGWYANAQNNSDVKATGIYITQADLQSNTMSLHALTDDRNCLHEQLGTITLIRDGKKSKLSYGDLSGYYKDGFRYRAHGNKKKFFESYGYYKVLDDSGLIIYSKRSTTHKTAGRLWFYYSFSIDSPIRSLTPASLREDFAEYPEFLDLAIAAHKNGTIVTNVNDALLINTLYLTKVKSNL